MIPCSLLIASIFIPRTFLLIVLIILAAATNVLVPAHTNLFVVILVAIDLRQCGHGRQNLSVKYWQKLGGKTLVSSPQHFLPQLS